MWPAVLLVVAAAVGASAPGTADQPQRLVAAEQGPLEEEVEADVSFRRAAGLDDDETHVRALVEAYRSGDATVTSKLGAVVTLPEAEELDQRLELQAQLGPVLDYGLERAASFGGIHTDHERGGIAVVSFTDDPAIHAAAWQDFPMPDRIEFRRVANTLAELEGIVAELSTTRMPAEGVLINGVVLRVQENDVLVKLDALTPSARDYFALTYPGGEVELTEGPTGTLLHSIVGGSPLERRPNATQPWVKACTSAFSARDGVGNYYVLTAGHCVLPGYQVRSAWYTHHSYTVLSSTESNGTDSAMYSVPYADTSSTAGWINPVQAAAGYHDDQPGGFLCWFGDRTGTQRCGVVVSKTFTSTDFSDLRGVFTTVTEARLLDGPLAARGDSGAPVYSGDYWLYNAPPRSAFGILRAVDDYQGYLYNVYSHIRYAMTWHGVTVPR